MEVEQFVTDYARALVDRALSDPEYRYAAADAEGTARRMLPALAFGHADVHGSPVLRALARRYGIPHTIGGWQVFASSLHN